MDDLASLDWNAVASKSQQPPPPRPPQNTPAFTTPALRSNLATATLPPQFQSRPNSALNGGRSIATPGKIASPANDSFSSLLPSTSTNTNKSQTSLTLQDRQKQLLEERQRQIAEQQQRHSKEAQLWDNLGVGSPGLHPQSTSIPASNGTTEKEETVEDILAGFSSSAKVDRSTHFPPPWSASQSGRSTPAASQGIVHGNGGSNGGFDDDDDPFGLSSMATQRPSQPTKSISPELFSADDDFLGELGKPVQPKQKARSPSPPRREAIMQDEARVKANSTPIDRSVAELVEMGFSADRARVALDESDGSVQSAVSWLLNRAHAEAQQKVKGRPEERNFSPAKSRPAEQGGTPTWMRSDSRSTSHPPRPESGASNSDRDVSQTASEVGASFLKSANSLWKAGRKQVQKAVADFQQQEPSDPNQPKWMRDTSTDSHHKSTTHSQARHHSADVTKTTPSNHKPIDMTDEAMLLESRPERPSKATARIPNEPSTSSPLRGRSPAQVLPERSAPPPRFPQQPMAPPPRPNKISRDQVEEQAAQAYVSSARRRKPALPKEPEPEVDLFSPAPIKSQPPPSTISKPQPASSRSASIPARPKVPSRNVPPVSPSILSQSAQHRAKGTEAFKRGDYDAAHQAYTAALTPLPQTHPVTIVVLTNRALTAIKTGEPKTAIQDADKALSIIGASRGENENIDLGSEGTKDMKDFYGKALMRKAEALEAMEKWADALDVWRTAIEAGVGGLNAVRGRDRCSKAANPAPAATAAVAKPKPVSRPAPARNTGPTRPQPSSGASQDAVRKLRAQTEAAERLDDEKFALADVVSARVEAWRGGKSDNLRALLASMEGVLWEGAGWKKVGMAELVLPNKVKIVYMRAIAKVHPDKISQDATTEQRMISGHVFSTLNEAWDKFKTENGL
ncbi:hypothetical protein ANO11243_018740 [Dothideomycetidae sp. 11243]|nr:hypothetical protein ANO11243_018740 [fungal sp. No.11243]